MLGDPLPPLHGVPFAVKDLVNTAGVRTTFGSVALADNLPAADSPSVARLSRGRRDPDRQDHHPGIRP